MNKYRHVANIVQSLEGSDLDRRLSLVSSLRKSTVLEISRLETQVREFDLEISALKRKKRTCDSSSPS